MSNNNVAVEQDLKLQLKVSEQEKGTLAARITELAAVVTRLEAELEEAAKRSRRDAEAREVERTEDAERARLAKEAAAAAAAVAAAEQAAREKLLVADAERGVGRQVTLLTETANRLEEELARLRHAGQEEAESWHAINEWYQDKHNTPRPTREQWRLYANSPTALPKAYITRMPNLRKLPPMHH